MRSFGTRIKGALAAALSAALIISGVALAAPTAYADEGAPAEVAQVEETPAAEAPAAEAPAEVSPAAEAPAEGPQVAETPAGDDLAVQQKSAPQVQLRTSASLLAESTPVGAQLSVSKSSGLDPEGETITVTGTGYDRSNGSIYAQIGWIIEGAWTPLSTADTRSANRASAYSAAVGYPNQPQWTVAEDDTGSFTWTVEVTEAALDAVELTGGTLAVFTLGSYPNWVQPLNERFVPISFADPAPVGAQLSVSKSSGLDPEGETITVTGTGYDRSNGSIYAQIGWIIEGAWTPLSTADTRSANRASAYSAAVGYPNQPQWTVAEDDTGSFTWTVEVTEAALDAVELTGGTLAVFTLGSYPNWVQPLNERFVPISFADPAPTNGVSASVAEIKAGESVTFDVSVLGLPSDINAAYVGFFEKPAVGALALAMDAEAVVVGGVLSTELLVEASQLDRTKSYEVVAWKKQSPLAGNVYFRADVALSDAQWDLLLGTGNNGGGDNGGGNNSGGGDNGGSTPPPAVTPVQGAGSLTWGISSSFIRYITGPIAHGRITTSGVGAGYLFPQASASSWNTATQTGTVQYSGSVNFYGHDGILDLTVANPVITVTSATSGTISAGVASGTLNLAAASKTVGANGEVTWSNVPVNGTISGGSGGSGGSSALDSLTFTVGAVSSVSFGSTSVGNTPVNRAAAATPPATAGITVVTPEDELVPGGEIEIEANGFESNERDILVVVYSDPIVLDRQAGANANGKVRWIGTLPEDLEPGQHTITLQGSINVGKVITVVSADEAEKAKAQTTKKLKTAAADGELAEAAAGPAAGDGSNAWVWWAGAIGLLIIAGGMTALVVTQRRRQDTQ